MNGGFFRILRRFLGEKGRFYGDEGGGDGEGTGEVLEDEEGLLSIF